MAKTYRVTVCRTAYAFKEFEIKADSQKQAEREALDMAGNYEYSEKDAEYSISGTWVERNVTCSLCGKDTPEKTAHIHQGKWIGDDCCWDERLRASE